MPPPSQPTAVASAVTSTRRSARWTPTAPSSSSSASADAERYARLAPQRRDRARPPAPSPPAPGPARLGADRAAARWSAQVGADVVHSPHYTMPLRAGRPVVVTLHDATFFTDAQTAHAGQGDVLPLRDRTALRRAARCIVPSKATARRARPRARGRPDRDRRRVPRRRPRDLPRPPTTDEVDARCADRLGLHGQPYVAFLGTLEPRKNVPNLIRGWAGRGRPRATRPRSCSPAAPAGTTRSTRRSPTCRSAPARAAAGLPAARGPARASSAARPSSPTRATARASACRCSRRWPAARRC